MTAAQSAQLFLIPMISTPGWLIASTLCLLGCFFMVPAARELHGSNIYWNELSWPTRICVVVVSILFSILPLANFVFLAYLLFYYVSGWGKYRRLQALRRQTFNKHHYATRNPSSPRAQPIRAYGESEIRPTSSVLQWPTPEVVLERYVTNVMNAMRLTLRNRIGLPQSGSRNQVRDRLLTLPKAQVEEIYKDAIIDLTLLNPLAGKHYGSAGLLADTEAAFAARVDYLALLASVGYYVTMPEDAVKNRVEYVQAIRQRYPDIQ